MARSSLPLGYQVTRRKHAELLAICIGVGSVSKLYLLESDSPFLLGCRVTSCLSWPVGHFGAGSCGPRGRLECLQVFSANSEIAHMLTRLQQSLNIIIDCIYFTDPTCQEYSGYVIVRWEAMGNGALRPTLGLLLYSRQTLRLLFRRMLTVPRAVSCDSRVCVHRRWRQ